MDEMMERCRLDYHSSYQNRERTGVPSGAAPLGWW